MKERYQSTCNGNYKVSSRWEWTQHSVYKNTLQTDKDNFKPLCKHYEIGVQLRHIELHKYIELKITLAV